MLQPSTDLTRRALLAAAPAAAAIPSLPPQPTRDPVALAADAGYWRAVAKQYDVTGRVLQLENGNWGLMSRPVLGAYERHTERVNRETSYYSRRQFGPDLARIRAKTAANLGVSPEEIVFTRNATEALLALIGGYNRLRPDDAVLYADLDYDSMQGAMRWLKTRRGVDVVSIALPEPASHQNLIDAYERALAQNPRVRLMLLTQVSHRTGLVLPVAEIMRVARARGVDVIVDSAHAWGQLAFTLPELGADFVGLNGHKWIGAPLGVGLAYIKRERLPDIDVYMGVDGAQADTIQSRVHTGTFNFAAHLGLEDALAFHDALGASAKEARLRHLRNRWAEAIRPDPRFQLLTPADSRLTCALTSFRLRGRTSVAENEALAARLLAHAGIFTVERSGVASGACVRVTPALFSSEADLDGLTAALRRVA